MAESGKSSDPFFPSIRDAAQHTDDLPDDDSKRITSADSDDKDDDIPPLQEVDSLCMTCGEQGRTRLLLTSIPYFREVIIMSFRCEHCGTHNNEIQSAAAVRDQGITYTLKVLSRDDLDRQLVKSANCTITIPEFQLTIPPGKGQLTNVEGVFRDTVLDLRSDQPLRRIQDPPTYIAIQKLIDGLSEVVADTDSEDEALSDETRTKNRVKRKEKPIQPFTVILDDPAGDSFVEFRGSMSDPQWNMRQYNRTREQNVALGLAREDGETEDAKPKELSAKTIEEAEQAALTTAANEEIFVFPGICSACGRDLDTMMKKVVIPYFKDIIIMSTNCQACGYRDNEVKSGGAVSDKGKKITLKVEDADDLGRDILKSETCGLEIPEIDLHLQAGTLGGRFTTLEGILTQVFEELSEKVFLGGDSSEPSAVQKAKGGDESGKTDTEITVEEEKGKFAKFLGKLKAVMTAEQPFTLILDDPLANSYLQNLYAPDDDPNMVVELYERTFEQNDDLGLNDIRLEGYEEDHAREVEEQAKEVERLKLDDEEAEKK